MSSRIVIVLGLLSLGTIALSGCGATCASACDAIHECEPSEDDTFCVSDCEGERDEASAAGCEAEFDDVVACIQNLADACDPNTSESCQSEFQSLAACGGE